MHQNTCFLFHPCLSPSLTPAPRSVAVAFTAREQVEQLKSASVKLAALRDRQREANRAIEAEL